MLKVGAIGIVAVFLAITFKAGKQEYGIYIITAAGILIFLSGLGQMEGILSGLNQIRGQLGVESGYFQILYKIVGITYIAEFSSGLCRDSGYGALAGQIELIGKLSILTISMPVVLTLLNTIGTFLLG